MKNRKEFIAIVAVTAFIAVVASGLPQRQSTERVLSAGSVHSPYAGEQARGIKALSPDDIEGLGEGAGTPFGGMAKPAELNGYPGPRHVIDAYEAGDFDLSSQQREQVQSLYEAMRAEAIPLGQAIIEVEKEIDAAFTGSTVTEVLLQEKIKLSADFYSQLRFVHLKTHLAMVEILTPEQVDRYNELRGYGSDDPCSNIPQGHDPKLWRAHNNCS